MIIIRTWKNKKIGISVLKKSQGSVGDESQKNFWECNVEQGGYDLFSEKTTRVCKEAIHDDGIWEWLSEGWDLWAENNNSGTHWRKKERNDHINEEDLNKDDNPMVGHGEQFLISGMEGWVGDRC